MLRSANLESRQSPDKYYNAPTNDAPLREFGIKAKHEADSDDGRCRMLRSANLESRQSRGDAQGISLRDAPLREFGIKAKLEAPALA